MNSTTIHFQKERELGEIISDTFRFLRENFRILAKLLIRVTGPVFIVLLLALVYYSYLALDTLQNPLFGMANGENIGKSFIAFFTFISALAAFYVLLYSTILHTIKSYVRHQGQIIETEVYQGIKDQFPGMLGLLLVSWLMIFFGLLLCVVPGVYLWVPLSIAPAVYVFKGLPAMECISESFRLIKDNWWTTFFIFFITVLLVYFIGLIFQVPMIFYMFLKGLTSAEEIRAGDPTTMIDWVTITFNVLSSLAQYILFSIVIITSALVYYSLDEKKNSTGAFQKIADLGSQKNS